MFRPEPGITVGDRAYILQRGRVERARLGQDVTSAKA